MQRSSLVRQFATWLLGFGLLLPTGLLAAEARAAADTGESEIVLITCTGAFDQSLRSYDDNLVVSARLDPSLSGTAAS